MLSPGSKAPEFSLLDLDGSRQTLTEILSRGRVLLSFYKVSCPVCQLTLPFLGRIADGPLPVVAISQDDAGATRRFQQKFGGAMPTLLDPDSDGYPASNAFGITHVPTLFLVEGDGTITLSSEGFVKSDLEAIGVPFGADEAVPAWKAG